MAVALNPAAYKGSDTAPVGLGWRDPLDPDAPLLTRNPRLFVTEQAQEFVVMWSGLHDSMGGGFRHLPESGGYLDQNAWTMTCLEEISATVSTLREHQKSGKAGF